MARVAADKYQSEGARRSRKGEKWACRQVKCPWRAGDTISLFPESFSIFFGLSSGSKKKKKRAFLQSVVVREADSRAAEAAEAAAAFLEKEMIRPAQGIRWLAPASTKWWSSVVGPSEQWLISLWWGAHIITGCYFDY